ncbi:hypothetical protein GH733_002527, partial [Mirounga leonina]
MVGKTQVSRLEAEELAQRHRGAVAGILKTTGFSAPALAWPSVCAEGREQCAQVKYGDVLISPMAFLSGGAGAEQPLEGYGSEMSQKTTKEGPRLSKNQKFSEHFSIHCCPPFTFLNSKREIVDRKYSICKSGCFYQKKEEDWICYAVQRPLRSPSISLLHPPRWSEHQPSHGPLRGPSVNHAPAQRSDHHQPSSAPLRTLLTDGVQGLPVPSKGREIKQELKGST